MKTNKLNTILSSVAAVAVVATFLFLIAKAICFDGMTYVRGYDLMFGNDAGLPTSQGEALPAFIAVFVFLIVGGVFSVLTAVFNSLGDEKTSHKFVSFLSVVGGLLLAASAVLFFLAPMFFGSYPVTATLYWGAIASGACSAVAAVASLASGVKGLLVK